MSIINKLFGSNDESAPKKEKKTLPWIDLTSTDQLSNIEEASKSKTQVIFKHSTRCGISRMAMNQFLSAYNPNLNMDFYYLDLLSHREVSDKVGHQFQVMHQSPQLLVIRNGQTVVSASHGDINNIDLAKYE